MKHHSIAGHVKALNQLALELHHVASALHAQRSEVTIWKDGSGFTLEQEVNLLAQWIYSRYRHSLNESSEMALPHGYYDTLIARVEDVQQSFFALYLHMGGKGGAWGTPGAQPAEEPAIVDAYGYEMAQRQCAQAVQSLFWVAFPLYERVYQAFGEGSSETLLTIFIKIFKVTQEYGKQAEVFPQAPYLLLGEGLRLEAFLDFVETLDLDTPASLEDVAADGGELRLSSFKDFIEAMDFGDDAPGASPGK